jgi:hypothetical protein
MAMTYQERKAKGQRKRAEYLRRLDHAEHLAVMFRGFGIGFSFIVVMTAVAGVHGNLAIVLFIMFMLIAGSGFIGAEHIMFWAEQSRYPKSRRRTLRSEIADEWREFRKYRKSKRDQK